jgi:hypothetical protein
MGTASLMRDCEASHCRRGKNLPRKQRGAWHLFQETAIERNAGTLWTLV